MAHLQVWFSQLESSIIISWIVQFAMVNNLMVWPIEIDGLPGFSIKNRW